MPFWYWVMHCTTESYCTGWYQKLWQGQRVESNTLHVNAADVMSQTRLLLASLVQVEMCSPRLIDMQNLNSYLRPRFQLLVITMHRTGGRFHSILVLNADDSNPLRRKALFHALWLFTAALVIV
jgi:hypothetical protein